MTASQTASRWQAPGEGARPQRGVSKRYALTNAIERTIVLGAKDRPIFVGGNPRSGTTLLRTMMHSHPDLAIPRETHFVLEAFGRRKDWGDLRIQANREKLARWLIEDNRVTRFRRLGLEREAVIDRLVAAPPTLGSLVGTAFMMYAERHGAPRWGDKRPLHIQRLPTLFAMFPDLQFVNIVRDPRSVVASMKKLGWFDTYSEGSVVGAIDLWLLSVRAGQRAQQRYRPDQFMELRYEDLLEDPEQQLSRICDFAGLSRAGLGAMLEFHRTESEIPERQREKYHPLLGQPLTTTAVNKWTEQLTEEEVAFVEGVAAEKMALYGYEPINSDPQMSPDLQRRWKAWQKSGIHKQRSRRSQRPHVGAYPVAARLTTAQRRRAGIAGGALDLLSRL